jgi:hypothetical protein
MVQSPALPTPVSIGWREIRKFLWAMLRVLFLFRH